MHILSHLCVDTHACLSVTARCPHDTLIMVAGHGARIASSLSSGVLLQASSSRGAEKDRSAPGQRSAARSPVKAQTHCSTGSRGQGSPLSSEAMALGLCGDGLPWGGGPLTCASQNACAVLVVVLTLVKVACFFFTLRMTPPQNS